jgi:hypothetical protein
MRGTSLNSELGQPTGKVIAVILRAFAHVTAQQRRLIFRLGDAAALEQLARRLHRLPSPCIEEELLG